MKEHDSINRHKYPFPPLIIALPLLLILLMTFALLFPAHVTYAASSAPDSIYLPLIINTSTTSNLGTATGRILWNDQPIAGVTVKLCTDWSMIGGCKTQVYSAVSGSDGHYTIAEIPAGAYDFATKYYQQQETGWLGLTVTVLAGQTVTVRDVNIVKYDLQLVSPSDNATVTSTPTLTWEPYPGTSYYKVYVVFRPTYTTVVNFEKVTTTQYMFVNPLAAGEYYWYIYAYNAAGLKLAQNDASWDFVVP